MGDSGSGRRRTREWIFVEDCEWLDINEIVKDGFTFYPVISFIEIDSKPEHLFIKAVYNSYFRRLIEVNQKIYLDITRPYLGGIRWYMRCPNCNQRVAKLYKPSGSLHFKCRKCHQLLYQSQESNVWDGWLKKFSRNHQSFI